MLDLPSWRGIVAEPRVNEIPTAVYFHENQWTYPRSPHARVDHHYGYTNLLTALSSDHCIFNSQFHLDVFLDASEAFIARMPDSRDAHDIAALKNRCSVIPPGFEPREPRLDCCPAATSPLRIGWVSRWEYDKRPDRLAKIVDSLEDLDIDFRLILCGSRPDDPSEPLQRLRRSHASRIEYDGYVSSNAEYWQQLRRMDVVLSTADHEFFGIAICEAVWAGAAPVLPKGLSYVELFGADTLYGSSEEAVEIIGRLRDPKTRQANVELNRAKIAALTAQQTAAQLDERLESLCGKKG